MRTLLIVGACCWALCRFLVDDTLELRVELQVEKDQRWAYDSRAETGYVGLKNQGATCYMNSLLQYLFHLPYFRKVCASAGK
jgi:ubiquitin carboxyl-terminal hydrolase 7